MYASKILSYEFGCLRAKTVKTFLILISLRVKRKLCSFALELSLFYLSPYHINCDTATYHLHLYVKTSCQWKLDGRRQHLMLIIFKIDQKSLSKLFITSQQPFTCSKSIRETLEIYVVLMYCLYF